MVAVISGIILSAKLAESPFLGHSVDYFVAYIASFKHFNLFLFEYF